MRSVFAVLLTVAIGACATGPECRIPPIPQPVHPWLWTVRGPKGAIIVFGTHHGASGDDIPEAAKRALAGSELMLVEAVEGGKFDTYDGSPEARYYLRRPDAMPSLMEALSNDDFAELKGRLGVSSQALARMRPWVALSLLMRTAITFPDPNVPTALSDLADELGVRVVGLDTWAQQTVFLDMTTDSSNVVSALHSHELACSFEADVARYRSGLEEAYTGPTAPKAYTANPNRAAAIAERQRVWTEDMIWYLSGGHRIFVAVGVQNLVGPDGVLASLAARGYAVERIDPH